MSYHPYIVTTITTNTVPAICLSGDATGNRHAKPPWSKLSNPETAPTLIESWFLPDGLLLSDPEKMPKHTVERLYYHWLDRQQ